MAGIPRAQEIYRHFKGNLYQVLTVAEHTETGETMVVYQAMYGEFKVYARPLEMFCSKVDKDKYPEVKQEYRFELQQSWNAAVTIKSEACEKETVKAVEKNVATEQEAGPKAENVEEELQLDPMLLTFLDAETYAEKLNILTSLHHRITDDMITTMAIASDIEIEEGDLEDRYMQLKNCLLTREKYEINRVR